MDAGKPHHTILWLIVLVAAIVASVVATVVDNVIKGDANRPHNSPLLIDECLAEQHSAYLIFFIALATGSAFNEYWGSAVLPIALLIAFMFYVKGIHLTTKHQEKIAQDHLCTGHCTAKLKPVTMLRIFGLNFLFALILFSAACYFAALSVDTPKQ